MGLIEQAAVRLEQLRKAGIEPPEPAAPRRPSVVARPAPEGPEQSQQRAPQPPPRPPAKDTRPVLRIDLARLGATGFITPEVPQSRVAAEFRMIKRTLLANAAPDRSPLLPHGNLIMVTSSVPGEGKTFAAVNLAMSIAMELDHKVLLVDADVARPSVPGLLGVAAGAGLLDKLMHPELDVVQLSSPTNVDKLEFMTSGRPHPRANEMLSSDAMSALVHELGSRYPERIVVFDSPPLLYTTEAAALARHMGQVVFVVSAGSTPVGDVKRALPMIEDCSVRLMLLNKLSPRGRGMHGYGYGYGYGQDG
ncbi:MAG TPA: XrtA-associated tyrosine autokinase [Usitatibacter sp.]|jgi:exopolysaccharide/PEP-CTERM locus tyrosine autokinase|nr:XrtA-associated tyrosine autokinase [Usitatibacter sp.]